MDPQTLPVTVLKGAGPRIADRLARLGIYTVQDVLFHLPYRYQDRTRIQALGGLQPGREVAVIGKVEIADVIYRGRRNLIVHIADGTGLLTLRFFHFSGAQQARFQKGASVYCYGEVRASRSGLEMIHPEYEFISDGDGVVEDQLTPVYPATEGVHQLTLRKLADQALNLHLPQLQELIPGSLLAEYSFPEIREAVLVVHRPPTDVEVAQLLEGKDRSQQRLAFEELLAYQLSLRELRHSKQQHKAPAIAPVSQLYDNLIAGLPFSLTGAQQRVIEEIRGDLFKPTPMQRLVQGDVGSGKTLVAAAAAALAIAGDYQVAVMAPTELLVEQHLANFKRWFEPLGILVVGLMGKLNTRQRRSALEVVADGEAGLVIGTHALFQEEVVFSQLGLVVVDEQHRFGVHQRLALREKGVQQEVHPHQLIMTATPIPRTLAQTFYADLDVSVVDELPPGRQGVTTVVLPDSRRPEVVERIRSACLEGRQAYWVCPLIEESESLDLQAAIETEVALKEALPELRVGLVHGRMKSTDKDSAMRAFKDHNIDLLVATTVIEVGVDVPNASLMVIDNAERLGLSQLHQLRGRVGRGEDQSSCVLLYKGNLSQAARQRLAVMRETSDGFVIAQKDLELRGPGEIWGTRQTGIPQFHIADIVRDQGLLPLVQKTAVRLQESNPEAIEPIIRRWLGRREHYADV